MKIPLPAAFYDWMVFVMGKSRIDEAYYRADFMGFPPPWIKFKN